MTRTQELHNRLIRHACATGGWKVNTNANGWRRTVKAMLRDQRWVDERDDVLEFMSGMWARPDLWQIEIDDDEDLLIIKFLEVEVWHHISTQKKNIYQEFWWLIDGTDGVRLQIWRMELWRDLRYDERPGLDTKYINDFGDAKDGTNPYDPGMRWNDSIRYDVVCVSLRGPRDGHRPDVPALYC